MPVCLWGQDPALASGQVTKLEWQMAIAVNTVLRLLMMDSKSVRNM